MKKIVFMLFFFCVIKNVYGIDPCQTNTNKESIWYKIEEESKYFILEENNKEYPLLDKTSFYKTDFTNWINVKPLEKKEREIEKRNIYFYKEIYPIHYLFLHHFSFHENNLNIKKIELYDDKNILTNYKITCENCISLQKENRKDISLKKDSLIKIELLNNIPTENLKIYIELENKTNVEVIATEKDDIKDVFYYKEYEIEDSNDEDPKYFINIYVNDLNKGHPRYKKEVRSENKIEEKYNRKVRKEEEYRYRDTLYRYYNLKKIYNKSKNKVATSEYPYKEVGFTGKEHCLEDKLITLKDRITSTNFSFLNLSKNYKEKKVVKKENKDKEKKQIILFPFIFIGFLVMIYKIKKKKAKLVKPLNE